MKITLGADGSITLDDISNMDGKAAVEALRELREATTAPKRRRSKDDPAELNPLQRETYKVVALHPEGCHYTVVAEYLNIKPSVANTRRNAIAQLGLAERIRAGVYRVKVA